MEDDRQKSKTLHIAQLPTFFYILRAGSLVSPQCTFFPSSVTLLIKKVHPGEEGESKCCKLIVEVPEC